MKKNKAKDNINTLKSQFGFSVYLGVLKENKCRLILLIKRQAHFKC
jgi:hypothetical protein